MAALVDSYAASNSDSSQGWGGLTVGHGQGQSFLGNGTVLDSAQFYLRKTTASAGQIAAAIFAVGSGTHGTNAVPAATGLGAPIAVSSPINVSSLPTSLVLQSLNFVGANRVTLASGTPYIAAIIVTSNVTGQFELGRDNSSATHSGNASRSISLSGNWLSVAYDFIFYVYGEDSAPASDAIKLKVADSFVDVTPKIKVAGSFIDITPKLKSGGSF